MPSITVQGMSCGHCQEAVRKALASLPGVSGVHVDLATGKAEWQESAPVSRETIRKAILDIGFGVTDDQ